MIRIERESKVRLQPVKRLGGWSLLVRIVDRWPGAGISLYLTSQPSLRCWRARWRMGFGRPWFMRSFEQLDYPDTHL